jgi:hypothetical protein
LGVATALETGVSETEGELMKTQTNRERGSLEHSGGRFGLELLAKYIIV